MASPTKSRGPPVFPSGVPVSKSHMGQAPPLFPALLPSPAKAWLPGKRNSTPPSVSHSSSSGSTSHYTPSHFANGSTNSSGSTGHLFLAGASSSRGGAGHTPGGPNTARHPLGSSRHGSNRSLDVFSASTNRPEGELALSSGVPTSQGEDDMQEAFIQLMKSMQIPQATMKKMLTMDASTKSQFLNASLRSVSSSSSLIPPRSKSSTPLPSSASAHSGLVMNSNTTPLQTSPRKRTSANNALGKRPSSSLLNPGTSFPSKDANPVEFARWLKGAETAKMDVERVKKLRMLLRHESTAWLETFVLERGYISLLSRLNDILNMEWREEQHDDQLLHEILRCVKALSTSVTGQKALRAAAPNPWRPLMQLLYSSKKPGDVAIRTLIIEIVAVIFSLWTSPSPDVVLTLPSGETSIQSFVRGLMTIEVKEEGDIDVIDFIKKASRERVFKRFVGEVSDVPRDYFWMFCHSGNSIWRLSAVDTSVVERAMAPGGATGGVEYEAVTYLTVNLKLLNALSAVCLKAGEPIESPTSAWRLHKDLFESGWDKIILAIRKASVGYYPHLHLEISRYIHLSQQAQYTLPQSIARLMDAPPEDLRKKEGGRERGELSTQGIQAGRVLGRQPEMGMPQGKEWAPRVPELASSSALDISSWSR